MRRRRRLAVAGSKPRVQRRPGALQGALNGPVSLLDLFEGRRQLIVYRFFFEPGASGWPERGCFGCSMMADQDAHPAHLNERDTTLVYVSRAPQADIERWKRANGLGADSLVHPDG